MSDVSQLLYAIEQGDPHAASQLLPLVYDELRRLAAQKMAHETPGQTLAPTELVHEAGTVVRRLAGPVTKGFHRVAWDLREPAPTLSQPGAPAPDEDLFRERDLGPLVLPGKYRVRMLLRQDGTTHFSVAPPALAGHNHLSENGERTSIRLAALG